MNIYSVPYLISAILVFLLSIFVLCKNSKSLVNRVFSLFGFCSFIWLICYSISYQFKEPVLAALWLKIGYIGIIFIVITAYHLAVAFLDLAQREKKLIIFVYLVGISFVVLLWGSDLFVKGYHKYFWGYYPKASILHPFYLIFLVTLVMRLLFLLSVSMIKNNKTKTINPYQYQRMKYVLIGLFVFSFAATDFIQNYGIQIYPLGFIFVLFYLGVMSYAILRYRLMNIEVIIRRAVIFAGLFGFVFFVFALTAGLAQIYLSQIISSKILALVITVLAITAFYDPIKKWLISITDRFLFQKEYDYQALLKEASKDMSRITDMNELLASIVHIFSSKLRLDNAGIYLLDKEINQFIPQDARIGDKFNELNPINNNDPLIQWLEQSRAPLVYDELEMFNQGKDVSRGKQLLGIKTQMKALGTSVIVPSFTENTLAGFLILGDKLSGRVYTQEDLNVLQVLSNQAALAIENCEFWQDVVEKERKARLQEMDAYSYSLAHEIDNPMQVILGQAGFLKMDLLEGITDENKKKELTESLDFIVETARRVSGMVKAIRDFGQKITGEFNPLNIEDVIESFSKLYYPQFKDKTVIFEKTSQLKGPVFVKGEKPELMQALVILANNSIHAMKDIKEKKAYLTLSLSNHNAVRITFSDNGYGIKKDMLSIIFTPFTTTKASSEGTGMGLYNAKKIIERHKGKIWAESEGHGKGASFIIELPVLKDVNQEELNNDNPSSKRLL